MAKSILTLFTVFSGLIAFGQLPENFKEEQWNKIDQDTQELVERLSGPACDCVDKYKEETDAFLKVIFDLAESKRKGAKLTEAMKNQHSQGLESCRPYFECLKKSAPSEDEKAQMTASIEKNIGKAEDDFEMKKFRSQMVGHAMRENCENGIKNAFNFLLLNVHLIGLQRGQQK